MSAADGGSPPGSITVVVGRVGRPHGVRGDVTVEVRTDEPEVRFAAGSTVGVEGPGAKRPGAKRQGAERQGAERQGASGSLSGGTGHLVVESHRWHSGRLLVHFEGVDDRTSVESLRGLLLTVEVDTSQTPDDPDEFYDHQLVGLSVVDVTGSQVGTVVAVQHGAQDLLEVEPSVGARFLVPFVHELVPEVDLAASRLVVDLPDGLTDLSARSRDEPAEE